ncbi:MAG: phosphatidate cytidylyltransferase [Microscillaceae bacterium]|nr:phosphatidate cytidylyltransferase [Microscillaceae bacterium]
MTSPSKPEKASDNLVLRAVYGFSGFFLMLGGMVWNQWSYGFVFLVIFWLCLQEFFQLVFPKEQFFLRRFGLLLGLLFYVGHFLGSSQLVSPRFFYWYYPLFSLSFAVLLYQKNAVQPFAQISYLLLGLVYVGLPFGLMHWAVFDEAGQYRYQVILGTFFLIWIHDIGAYFGLSLRAAPPFPRISPSKSWEGSAGGALLTLGMAFLLNAYLHDLHLGQWLGLAGIVIVVGTHGDLVESMLKRSVLVKDSSQALPGHGGFLDRFDNFLLSAPFIALFLKFF